MKKKSKKNSRESLILADDEAALVIGSEDVRLVLPAYDDKNENVPDYILFIVTIAILINKEDEEFMELIARKTDSYWEKFTHDTQ